MIIRFEILLWISGNKKFSDPSRNRPKASVPRVQLETGVLPQFGSLS